MQFWRLVLWMLHQDLLMQSLEIPRSLCLCEYFFFFIKSPFHFDFLLFYYFYLQDRFWKWTHDLAQNFHLWFDSVMFLHFTFLVSFHYHESTFNGPAQLVCIFILDARSPLSHFCGALMCIFPIYEMRRMLNTCSVDYANSKITIWNLGGSEGS